MLVGELGEHIVVAGYTQHVVVVAIGLERFRIPGLIGRLGRLHALLNGELRRAVLPLDGSAFLRGERLAAFAGHSGNKRLVASGGLHKILRHDASLDGFAKPPTEYFSSATQARGISLDLQAILVRLHDRVDALTSARDVGAKHLLRVRTKKPERLICHGRVSIGACQERVNAVHVHGRHVLLDVERLVLGRPAHELGELIRGLMDRMSALRKHVRLAGIRCARLHGLRNRAFVRRLLLSNRLLIDVLRDAGVGRGVDRLCLLAEHLLLTRGESGGELLAVVLKPRVHPLDKAFSVEVRLKRVGAQLARPAAFARLHVDRFATKLRERLRHAGVILFREELRVPVIELGGRLRQRLLHVHLGNFRNLG